MINTTLSKRDAAANAIAEVPVSVIQQPSSGHQLPTSPEIGSLDTYDDSCDVATDDRFPRLIRVGILVGAAAGLWVVLISVIYLIYKLV